MKYIYLLALTTNIGVNIMSFHKIQNPKDIENIFPKNIIEIENITNKTIKETKDKIEKIINIPNQEKTFNNTAKALDLIEGKFLFNSNIIRSIELVNPNENMRKTSQKATLRLEKFAVDEFLSNLALYKAFKVYVDGNAKKEKLNDEEKYYLKEKIKEFKRQGLNLPKKKLEQIKKLKKELSELSLKYQHNVASDNKKLKVGKKDLKGINQDFINNLKKEKNYFLIGTDYPTYFEIMQNCSIETTRKNLFHIFMNRAYPENINILNKIIQKRDELAKILGYKSYAHFDLEDTMIEKPEKAEKFLADLINKAQKKEEKEFQELVEHLPENVKLNKDNKIKPWDKSYIKNLYKKKMLNVDENLIAEYFPMEKTIENCFKLFESFFNLSFKEITTPKLWDKEVKLFEVRQKKSNKILSFLLLDLYPRDNKFKHACQFCISNSFQTKSKEIYPSLILIIANLPKSTRQKPSLLKFNDLLTLVHEFGHAMHSILGCTELIYFSGTNVKTDFVETPSQFQEEWLFDRNILKKISCHYKTNQPLPDNLITKKISLKQFDSGDSTLTQCIYSKISLACFKEGSQKDIDKIIQQLYTKYIKHTTFYREGHIQAAFEHLLDYGAKYYSYMWSKVLALDLFYFIKRKGLFNPEISRKYIQEILSKGGSVDPNIITKKFLGRKPNQHAFLEDLGFLK